VSNAAGNAATAAAPDPSQADTEPVGIDLPRVVKYLTTVLDRPVGPLRAHLLPGGRSNLTYRLTGDGLDVVLRRPPFGTVNPSAHDMGREFRVVHGLHGAGFPVPTPITLCTDESVIGVPFSLVDFVPGRVIRTREDLATLTEDQVKSCASGLSVTLARLHAIPYESVGLALFGRPDGYLHRQVSRWRDQWDRIGTRPSDDLITLHARLAQSTPAEAGAAVVHGDYRIDNVLLDPADPGRVRGVVDWEMATIGDPLADLGLSLAYRDPAFEPVLGGSAAAVDDRMPTPREMAKQYARASGRPLDNLDFYVGLGYFKAAVIAEGIHARFVDGMTVGDGFDRVGPAVPELLAAGLRALAGRW